MLRQRLIAAIAGLALILTLGAQSVTGAASATAAPTAAAAAAPPAADRMPGDVPTKKTPWMLNGQVYKVVQVGDTMIAGGLFTQVAVATRVAKRRTRSTRPTPASGS